MLPPCVIVGGGKGGVGKSTITAALALALTRSDPHVIVGVLDADLSGPNQDIILNCAGPVLVRAGLMEPCSAGNIRVLGTGMFGVDDRPFDWNSPTIYGALRQMFFQTNWDECGVLLVDLPAGTGAVHFAVDEFTKSHSVGQLFVTTPSRLARADFLRAFSYGRNQQIRVLAVLENGVELATDGPGHGRAQPRTWEAFPEGVPIFSLPYLLECEPQLLHERLAGEGEMLRITNLVLSAVKAEQIVDGDR